MRRASLVCKTHLKPVFPPGGSAARLMRGFVCRSDRPKSFRFVGVHRLMFFKFKRQDVSYQGGAAARGGGAMRV
jgi:hypothetical protein